MLAFLPFVLIFFKIFLLFFVNVNSPDGNLIEPFVPNISILVIFSFWFRAYPISYLIKELFLHKISPMHSSSESNFLNGRYFLFTFMLNIS